MSMVTVHGPNTMYTTQGGVVASSPAGGGSATADPTNGLKWTFQAPGARPAGDYAWTFGAGASPATGTGPGPIVVTYSGAGAKTNTLVVSGAGTPPPANNTYNFPVNATAGVPRELESGGEIPVTAPADGTVTDVKVAPDDQVQEGDVVATEAPTTATNGEYEEYDPSEHTVNEVVAEAEAANDPDYTQALIDAERAGKNRSTLISHLESLL